MSNIVLYLPKVLQKIKELEQICKSEDTQFNIIEDLITKIYNETIVDIATEYGIKRYENILGIIPSSTDSLSVRRFRIINLIQMKLPFTKIWLKNKLTEITGSESGWVININYQDYIVTIVLSGLDTQLMGEVQKQLREAIPANMGLEIGGEALTSSDILGAIGVHLGYKIVINSNY